VGILSADIKIEISSAAARGSLMYWFLCPLNSLQFSSAGVELSDQFAGSLVRENAAAPAPVVAMRWASRTAEVAVRSNLAELSMMSASSALMMTGAHWVRCAHLSVILESRPRAS